MVNNHRYSLVLQSSFSLYLRGLVSIVTDVRFKNEDQNLRIKRSLEHRNPYCGVGIGRYVYLLASKCFALCKMQLKASCCSWSLLATVKCDGQWANIWDHSLNFEATVCSEKKQSCAAPGDIKNEIKWNKTTHNNKGRFLTVFFFSSNICNCCLDSEWDTTW